MGDYDDTGDIRSYKAHFYGGSIVFVCGVDSLYVGHFELEVVLLDIELLGGSP